MYFPKVSEITTTEVISISRASTLAEAIDMLFRSNHRNVVVTGQDHYYLLSIYEILRLNREQQKKNILLETLELPKMPTIYKEKSIIDTLAYLHNDFEQIVVLNDDNSLYGIITQSDILSSIDPDTLMDNYRLSDLLHIKKRNRWIDKEETTLDIFNTMERYKHDATMIVEAGKPIGIITTKDILRLLKSHVDLSLPIKTYMVSPVETISQYCTLNEALSFMQDKSFKRIVTVDDEGILTGSITQKELISIAYTRWVRMMQTYQKELRDTNEKLEQKSRKFEKIAATDSLTGLYNRMKFLELFVSEYTVMVQRENALSLLVIDLDHFKQVNDTYGHNIGDEMLKQISNLLLRELRNVDILCRWGGEEFVALLPAADCDTAYRIAEKLCRVIEAFSLEGMPCITASIGVSQIRESDDLNEVIERADKALYAAKMSGRNCVKKATL
ncbi:diguanylate cyclase [Sulfurovum riftiae]|uniref:diguanylate cyclase n=1 Tax=Sulfurovum riftiae TaxID=1630136 RepID=A0A151CHV6_9BACT|nr:diguanylate cyclase [Sulfurovum riftiae]KYJ87101.1 diguanylate cyclase [Sulfurovum riftiae]